MVGALDRSTNERAEGNGALWEKKSSEIFELRLASPLLSLETDGRKTERGMFLYQ